MGRIKSLTETQNQVKTIVQNQTTLPRQFHVILLNDDYTPMDFVVEILKLFFHKDEVAAVQIMLEVHTQGKAICGTYSFEIAETKQDQVIQYAQTHQHPLICTIEAM